MVSHEKQGEEANESSTFARINELVRKFIFGVISIGPLPNHIAFIMDGNRRYAKEKKLEEKDGYQIGFFTLISIVKYCYELGIRHISIYAFSIDNFKRQRNNVKFLMELMQEKLEELIQKQRIANEYGLRISFVGNLNLLSDRLKDMAKKATEATAHNEKILLQVCVAYTTTDEIVHAVDESCRDRWRSMRKQENHISNNTSTRSIDVVDIEKLMYMSEVPEPDILVRTSGEARLSNFILWHTPSCFLYSPKVFWPEFGLWHLVSAILNFQYHHRYLQEKRELSCIYGVQK